MTRASIRSLVNLPASPRMECVNKLNSYSLEVLTTFDVLIFRSIEPSLFQETRIQHASCLYQHVLSEAFGGLDEGEAVLHNSTSFSPPRRAEGDE